MIVFDLDGTLALDHHRKHFLEGDVKYWDEYFNACMHDELNVPIATVLYSIAKTGARIGIWTGRSETVEKATYDWLRKHQIMPFIDEIRMRGADDRTQDDVLKKHWLDQLRSTGGDVRLVFEDRTRVVAMWRAEGVTCCQVAPGDF